MPRAASLVKLRPPAAQNLRPHEIGQGIAAAIAGAGARAIVGGGQGGIGRRATAPSGRCGLPTRQAAGFRLLAARPATFGARGQGRAQRRFGAARRTWHDRRRCHQIHQHRFQGRLAGHRMGRCPTTGRPGRTGDAAAPSRSSPPGFPARVLRTVWSICPGHYKRIADGWH